ncbi:glycosyltransferase family 9 protein [Segetibacter sp.]|uniref:glycosyltransferase family 9 protein n=1 Tax=Segetibacter sp. TaxID=2231182 RepID=UPI002632CC58|nr:glycosyltransferase family 9 protein [Segetibacter sp.]MCW3080072.1 glycosyl transferase family 9 [Segetibacter sp.]
MKLTGIKKIVVFRALQIGDMLCSIPAIRALKQAYPDAQITLVGLPWAKMLIERFPAYFDSLITFPGYPGFPEQPVNRAAFPDFLKLIQQQQFDLALQMQGSGIISNPLVDLFGANNIAGFYTPDNYCPDKDLFIEYPSNIHEVRRHLQLIKKLGLGDVSPDLEFPITEKDKEDFAKAALPVNEKEYVILHPGARGANRQWAPANFAAIGDFCFENGLKVVITGTQDELDIVQSVIQLMKHKPINAAGKTSLGAVAVLIKNAAALVSNCTGVSHIAAALKTKSIVISLDGEPFRWGPLNKQLHKTIDWTVTTNLDLVKEALGGLLLNGLKV